MKIAAFNVKTFGEKKVNDEFVRRNLIKIVSRYSVVVMLEVRDKSGEAMKKFLVELNKTRVNICCPFAMVSSKPLGRGNHMEQFVFFYRKNEVKKLNFHQYKEKTKDVLAREPFVLQLECRGTAVEKLVLIPVHSKPQDAKIELDALGDVVENVRARWRNDNIMILGDFNADGRYLSQRRRENVSIASSSYTWLIADDVDTTTSNSNSHTYDRIVVFGQHMANAVVPGSATSFNFQAAYGLSDDQAKAIKG
uniref:Endonuclease/exonuclease/phosphatase domain-containing protein n=1 Tax=Anabas testudineus TaxID=64144 RepID=A0A7N6BUH1_ANATE